MMCADCEMEMNHHADKLNLVAALDDAEHIDPDLGGVLEEAHTCPGCGKTEFQIAT
ncbi:MAG: hypothetical protein L0229_22145 [Blastocatellia bacterium]|nr:hypothetical protein [Blastocatellia bacterium]